MLKHLILLILVLCVGFSQCTTWNDPNLDNWEEGWTVNIYGDPIDCDGKPCITHKLTKPSLDSIDHVKSCGKTRPDGTFDCTYLPEGAIAVDTLAELFDDDL
ncbi:uncharacterized protein BX664DRAFT_344324 [Halteromyces radiatus]|uniref:uncharacterized protein n=1 Tax=Halteromyces radiatus TaxID=101107 RepID=UPI0022211A8B|nr:uncharacterized protein BX664DRAFT_344324 [Halteromyces radiatus]KAI8076312.1 hypothetical protein BX664DRAFT_344324 [Halteromyces radiatus]